MANSLASNPFVIDTASSTAIVSGMVRIYDIEWEGYVAAAHHAVVTDGVGNTLFDSYGRDDRTILKGGAEGWVRGLIVPTLDSGTILIYYR